MRKKKILILFTCLLAMLKCIYGQSGGIIRGDDKTADKTRYEYFIGGKQVTEEEFIKNNKTGTKKTYINEILRYEDELKDGKYNGKQFIYFINGKVDYMAEYKNGKRFGCLVEWYENGQIKTLGYDDSRDSQESGRLVNWDEEGNLVQGSIKTNERYKSTSWDKNGNKRGEIEKTNNGDKARSWYENGVLAYEYELKEGKEILEINYYESAQKKSEKYLIEGSDRIREIKYYTNGQIKFLGERNSNTDEREGLWVRWEESGKVQSIEMWKDGRKIGWDNMPTGAPAVYFPKEMFYDSERKIFDMIAMKWYSRQLDALNEPVLYNSKTINEAYRFTYLRSYDEPVAVRIENENGQVYLYTKMTDGKGGEDPGGLIIHTKKMLSMEQWDHFCSLIEKINYWKMEAKEKDVLPKKEKGVIETVLIKSGGAQWILEGVRRGRYHFVDRWSPDQKNIFRQCCEYLLELSDLKLKEIY